jgi:hypothetical protein
MAVISLKAYETSVTVLAGASEMNSLANNNLGALTAAGTGVILDNTSLLDMYADFEFNSGTLPGAPVVGNKLDLYMVTSLDGTNYETFTAAGTVAPDASKKVGSFVIETTATTQRLHIWRVPLVPGKMKFALFNACGQALPATLATVIAFRYNLQSV